ncbi:ABC transporter permease [Pannonibacter phragmitetus]|uniref:ABC transporter permease n=1 Tax=Pannonibacter phragmitetus TaxID=121719 RepID=UPI003D2EFCD4
MTRHLCFMAGLAALVLLWSLAARETLPAVLPGPLAVLQALVDLFADKGFWRDAFLPSLARAASGLALALAAGAPLGLLAWRWGLVSAFLAPLRLLTMSIPAPILAILLILWFDGGTVTVTLTVAILLLPVFQIAVAEGMSAIDPELAEMARIFQVPLLPRLRRIVLPAVWTAFGPALRVATANALRVTLLTELLSGAEGLGAAVQRAQSWLQTDRLFALVAVILLLIGLAETLLSLIVNKRQLP